MAAPRRTVRTASLRVKPLVLALAGVFPVAALHAAGPDVRLPTQHGTFTPTNSVVTVNRTLTDTTARLDVTQTATRAITQWSAFNVGSNSQVNFYMPTSGSAMLARVMPGTAAPQQILGQVNTFVGAVGSKQVGGELFLVNAGGWLFGNTATVNVGSLVASTLDVRNTDFLNGLASISQAQATFSWKYAGGVDNADATGKYAPGLYQANGLVQLDEGAKISTTSGGRVFLFAPKVVNAGTISTPDGQTMLAGGGEVFLNNPQFEKLYASEVNENVPAVRGLLVEVNNGQNGEAGSVTNAGEIISARGNTTLVAMAVRQSGRIAASTSSTSNGSVLLAARSGVEAKEDPSAPGVISKRAQQGGALVIDRGSLIDMAADETGGATTASTSFTASRVELSGKTIDMLAGARIQAPGAKVNVRAEDMPGYGEASIRSTFGANGADPKGARFTMAAGSSIDVSGTTTAQIDAAKRNFITPSLVTNSDLKDAPLQKDGPIFHSENATFDVRQGVPMFSSTQGYKDAALVTTNERMATGGSVNLYSTGAVVTHNSSNVNVSGGAVNFSSVGLTGNDGNVLLTGVRDAAGNLFTLNTAPADRAYTLASPTKVQEGAYVQGAAAGSFSVTGGQLVMRGQLQANTVTGTRQAAGLDPLAARAKVNVNAWMTVGDRTAGNVSAALAKLETSLGKQAAGAYADYFELIAAGNTVAAAAFLPAGSVLNPSLLSAQAGSVNVQTDGGLHWLAGNDIHFVPGATVSVTANGGSGLQINSSIRDAGGTVSLTAVNLTSAVGSTVISRTAGLTLGDGQSVDVSGRFVNQALDGTQVAALGTSGGKLNLFSDTGMYLGKGSVLDVSGGAVWSASRSLSGKAAGTLTLKVNQEVRPEGGADGDVNLLGEWRGFSLTQGGGLVLSATQVQIGGEQPTKGAMWVQTDDLAKRGFGSYSVAGTSGVTVAANSKLTPRQLNWNAGAGLSRATTDTVLSKLVSVFDKGEALRTPTNLSLTSARGSVVVGKGATITMDPGATADITATTGIDFEGQLSSHGGTVNFNLTSIALESVTEGRGKEASIWLGSDSIIDVSGQTVLTPGTGSLRQGKMLAGGSVTLNAGTSVVKGGVTQTSGGGVVVIADGAQINLDGAKDTFDTRVATATGTVLRKVETGSAGGSLLVNATHGAVLEGSVSAQGGTAKAVDGQFTLNFTNADTPSDDQNKLMSNLLPQVYNITLQKDASALSKGYTFAGRTQLFNNDKVWGNATVSSAWLDKAGFADVKLITGDRIVAGQTATISAGRSLTLSSRALYADASQALTLAAPLVSLGNGLATVADHGLLFNEAATAGQGAVTVQALKTELNNLLSLQGINKLDVQGMPVAGSNTPTAALTVALRSTDGSAASLDAQGDVTFRAAQVYTESDSNYTINDIGYTVKFTQGDASLAKPLTAGGQVTVNAKSIDQDGVLRAPFGRISLNADTITLRDGSETSVSGAGLLVPFGSTVNGSTWTYADANDTRATLLDKRVTLNTGDTGGVTVGSKAVVDARGGGDVYAREFISGPGGSKDIFTGAAGGAFAVMPLASANVTGFAVTDRAILSATDASGAVGNLTPGQQITFGANGVLPAGTYVVLPADYASMPGAYLVKADTGASRAGAVDLTAPVIKLDDGSASVAAVTSHAGTGYSDAIGRRYVVMGNSVSSKYSQINLTSGSAFFKSLAAYNQVTPTGLTQDGGTVRVITPLINELPYGAFKLAGDSTEASARGGTLELGVSTLHIGDSALTTADGKPAVGVSEATVASLNATGASTLLLGGTVDGINSDGELLVKIKASTVNLDASAQGSLQAADVTLVGTDTVALAANAGLKASGSAAALAYHISGAGASVRVSANAASTLTRSEAGSAGGQLVVGKGASLQAATGQVAMEATKSVTLDPNLNVNARTLSIGAPALALGQADQGYTGTQITGNLLTALGQVQDLTLRSYGGIDFFKTATGGDLQVGSVNLGKLTLDAGTLQGHGNVNATATAQQVVLRNTSGALSASTGSGTGTLTLKAQGGKGQILVATGVGQGSNAQATTVGVEGFANTQLVADSSVVAAGRGGSTSLADGGPGTAGGLNVTGNLKVDAASVTADSGSTTALRATGLLSTVDTGKGAATASGLGAHLLLQADSIQVANTIAARSGALTLQAKGATGGTASAIQLQSGAILEAQGATVTLGAQSVNTAGGLITLAADRGSVWMDQAASLNVSAAGAQSAGQLSVVATRGSVSLQGALLGQSQTQDLGATLVVDAKNGVVLDDIADRLAAGAVVGGKFNFAQQVSLRSRGDDKLNLGTNKDISSAQVAVVSDGGDISIQGGLHADTATGGSVLVAAGKNLTLDGAQLSARSTSTSANVVSSAGRIDLQSASGTIAVNNQTTVDLSAANTTASGGLLALRAIKSADNGSVNIKPLSVKLVGARAVQVEGVKVWSKAVNGNTGVVSARDITSLDTTGTATGSLSLNTVLADAKAFNGNAASVTSTLAGGNSSLAGLMDVRAGEEIVGTGAITLNKAWNLSALDVDGARLAGSNAVNLTIRAAGDLNVLNTLSDGFTTTTAAGLTQATLGGDIRLVAGADAGSALLTAVNGTATGNLSIGASGSTASVLVRTTTGNLSLAAGHDVNLQSTGAAVYTTGILATGSKLTAYEGLPTTAARVGSANTTVSTTAFPSVSAVYTALKSGTTNLTPFYTASGSINVQATHDVLGAAAQTDLASKPANWLYTAYMPTSQQTTWWTRYDKFTQGVAALGGGNVKVQAGGSVQDMQLAAAGGGFQQAATGISQNFGAGVVSVNAGQSILGGTVVNTGDSATLRAGEVIGASARVSTDSGLQGSNLLHFNGVNTVSALGNVQMGTVADAARSSQFLAMLKGNDIVQADLTSHYAKVNQLGKSAKLAIQSSGGDVGWASDGALLNTVVASNKSPDVITTWSANDLSVTAPTGSIKIGAIVNQKLPASGGQLSLLAAQDLHVAGVGQQGAAAGGANDSKDGALAMGLDTDATRAPVVFVADQGDLTLGKDGTTNAIRVVRPLQAYAGQDMKLYGSVEVQHQAAQELSVVQAGRDVRLMDNDGNKSSIIVRGQGDLLVTAGRDISLGTGAGIVTNGNQANSALTTGSANATLMAGTKLATLDATLALSEGRLPQLLGGMAFLTAQTADLQVASVRASLALLGASVTAFDAALDNAKASYVAGLGTSFASLGTAQRLAAFDTLSSEAKGLAIGNFLAAHVLGKTDAATAASPQDFNLNGLIQARVATADVATRSTLALQVAQALGSPYIAQLRQFVADNRTSVQAGAATAQAATTALTDAQVLSAFASMPVARQVLFTKSVLNAELRAAGRSAVNALSDTQRDANYQRGYDAVATMFSPSHAQASGDITMPLSKVRSIQGGDINLFAPVGGVNGGLTSGSTADYGVVAMGGGEVNAVVQQNYLVNTSRVFTLGGGDLLMWSSEGNIDAGKGARTVSSAATPVFYLDSKGTLQVDTTAAISGSGIASSRDLDVYAPHGVVDSGDAGLRSAGAASLGGARVVCIGCSFGGVVVGLPVAAPVAVPVANATPLSDNTKAGPALGDKDDDAKKKKRKRQLQIDFLGFGVAITHPMDMLLDPGLSQWWADRQAKAGEDAAAARAMVGASAQQPAARRWLTSWLDKPVNRQ
jgi:filamentous hemagglutinin family protein